MSDMQKVVHLVEGNTVVEFEDEAAFRAFVEFMLQEGFDLLVDSRTFEVTILHEENKE